MDILEEASKYVLAQDEIDSSNWNEVDVTAEIIGLAETFIPSVHDEYQNQDIYVNANLTKIAYEMNGIRYQLSVMNYLFAKFLEGK